VSFNLADLFETVVDADPDREVVVAGERRLTYRELDERANRLANYLAESGVGPDDPVGLQLANGTEYVEAMLAAFKLRAIPINVNYRYVERELRYLYDDSGIVALIYHRQFGVPVGKALVERPGMHSVLVVEDGSDVEAVQDADSYEDALTSASPDRPKVDGRSDDDLYLIYTGGTTGMPKGVVWRHEDIFKSGMGGGDVMSMGNHVKDERELAERLPPPGIVALATPPLMHASAHWLAFHTLYTGGKLVMMPLGRFDPPEIWETIGREKVLTLVVIGDAMAKPLLDELEANHDKYDTSGLWVVASGGAALSEHNKERIRKLLPDRMIVDTFGSSETGVLGPKGQGGDAAFTLNEFTAVLDENNKRVEPGSGGVGKVARRGHVPLRYHNDEEKTAKTFVEAAGERWAITGDDATVEADGTVRILGRGSQCINTGGEKVYPEEVEEPLRSHPDVEDAVVIGVPDDRWGERVVAVVQPVSGRQLTLEDLQKHVREHIAGYKVPRDLVLVDKVERSPAGKPDYRWARERADEVLAAK
jgi:acyl-CoA synthetase (AMP-forming)/AMP-acid ligase II